MEGVMNEKRSLSPDEGDVNFVSAVIIRQLSEEKYASKIPNGENDHLTQLLVGTVEQQTLQCSIEV
jgi:hypothetical protein